MSVLNDLNVWQRYKHFTHWGRVTHICVSKLTTIVSDNGLSPGRRQAIIWTNGGILLPWPLGTTFSEIVSEIHSFSFKKMHLKMSSGKQWPFCLGLNVLKHVFPLPLVHFELIELYSLRLCLKLAYIKRYIILNMEVLLMLMWIYILIS